MRIKKQNISNSDLLTLISKHRLPIMGFSALYIYMFHEYLTLFYSYRPFLILQEWIRGFGYIGVDIFFFLSGMGLIYSIQKTNLAGYYYRRFRRLAFPWIVMAITIMVVNQWSLERFLKNISGVSFFTESIYAYLWFVPAISVFYIVFPLYYYFFSRQNSKLIFTLQIIAVCFLLTLVSLGFLRDDMYCFINRIPIFVIGIYLGWKSKNGTLVSSKAIVILMGVLLLVGIYLTTGYLYFDFPKLIPIFEYSFPSVLIAIPLTFFLAKAFSIIKNKKVGKLIYKVFAFLGTISLELYCVQEFLGARIVPLLNDKMGHFLINIVLFAVVLIAAIILSVLGKLFWKVFDGVHERLFVK